MGVLNQPRQWIVEQDIDRAVDVIIDVFQRHDVPVEAEREIRELLGGRGRRWKRLNRFALVAAGQRRATWATAAVRWLRGFPECIVTLSGRPVRPANPHRSGPDRCSERQARPPE
jgi:hypothetical protein